jgi:glycosyltransferase involved in cell wall biosynthesis
VTDQRVNRTALTLHEAGYDITAIGRRLRLTPKNISKEYRVKLFNLPFSKGVLFYVSFNLWAFFYLLFNKFDLVHANDLDSLLAAKAACFIKQKPLVYDSHELFTELPELVNRNLKKAIWFRLEKWLTKGISHCSTVSNGVANELNNRYGLSCEVIRNLPFKQTFTNSNYSISQPKTIIYQGALNKGRGIEKLIEALQYIPDATLLIVGTGDIENKLISLSREQGLFSKIKFTGRINPEELIKLTRSATIGVSLEEDLGLNYRYALPNKLFDYIQAGLPVLTTNLPEMSQVIAKFDVGQTLPSNFTPQLLANKINQMLNDDINMLKWHSNALVAAKILCWENEKEKLTNLVKSAFEKYL